MHCREAMLARECTACCAAKQAVNGIRAHLPLFLLCFCCSSSGSDFREAHGHVVLEVGDAKRNLCHAVSRLRGSYARVETDITVLECCPAHM